MRRLFIVALGSSMLILGSVSGVFAAGNYWHNEIVWSKSACGGVDCVSPEFHIWKMNDNGTGKTRLENSGTVNEHPVFSDDGSKIVWTRDMDIWIMNADGTVPTQLTGITDSYHDNHPYTFDPDGTGPAPEKIYFIRDTSDGNGHEIWRMNMNGTVQERSDAWAFFSLALGSKDRWHPSVATYDDGSGPKDYLVYLEGNEPGGGNDNDIYIFDLTTGAGPVVLTGEDEVFAPTITPDGTAVLYSFGGALLPLYIKKRDLMGTPMAPGNDITTVLTSQTTGHDDITPYADYTLPASSDEMDFVRNFKSDREFVCPDAEIFHKTGLNGLAPAPTNISNDPGNTDTIVLEPSGCNPDPISRCPTRPRPGVNTLVLMFISFLTIATGSIMLFWQRRGRSLKVA